MYNAKELLFDYSLEVTLNASDFFMFACADAVKLDSEDYEWALPVIEKHGALGVDAVMCMVRGCLPIKPRQSPELLALYQELLDLNIEVASEG